MSAFLLIWMLCALLACWWVGLYRRLTRLRVSMQQALAAVDQPLAGYYSVLEQHFLAEGVPSDAAWLQLVDRVKRLPATARNAPLAAASLEKLAQVLNAIAMEWEQLQQQPADLAGARIPPDLRKRWQEAEFNVRAARNGFNQLVRDYNAALRQFPARVVVRLMGFRVMPDL